jgi:hypothetical protein
MPTPTNNPPELIVPTIPEEMFHNTVLVMFRVDPSEYVPTTVNCWWNKNPAVILILKMGILMNSEVSN